MQRRDFLLGFSATGAAATAQMATAQGAEALAAGGVRPVPAMAGLRALKPTSDNDIAWLRGHRRPNDGGEGLFQWDPDSQAPDNGGTVIAPAGRRTGRWVRAYSGPINVRWFESVKSAIDFAATVSAQRLSATLYFPASEKPYNLTDIIVPDYISILGDGRYSRVSGRPTFSSDSSSFTRAEVVGLSFDDGINLVKAREFLFRNCLFRDSVLFDPVFLNHYNTFLHCSWEKVTNAIYCTGKNHFNKLISCRISCIGPRTAIKIGRNARGEVADAWNFVATSVEGHWSYSGPFGPSFDLDGKGHYASGIYMEIPAKTIWNPGPVKLRGAGIDFSFVRITGEGEIQISGNDNTINGRRYISSQSRYGVAENYGGVSISPNAIGEARIQHGLWARPSFVLVNVVGNTGVFGHVTNYDDRNIVVRLTNISGEPVKHGSYQAQWLAKI